MQTHSRSPRWMRVSVRGLGWVGGGLLLYLAVAICSFLRSPLTATHNGLVTWWMWASFGLSLFNALLFLCIGAFVWLYTRAGLVSRLLSAFAYCMMVTFLCQVSASANDLLMSDLSGT